MLFSRRPVTAVLSCLAFPDLVRRREFRTCSSQRVRGHAGPTTAPCFGLGLPPLPFPMCCSTIVAPVAQGHLTKGPHVLVWAGVRLPFSSWGGVPATCELTVHT